MFLCIAGCRFHGADGTIFRASLQKHHNFNKMPSGGNCIARRLKLLCRTRFSKATGYRPGKPSAGFNDRAVSRRHDGHRFLQFRRPARRRVGRDHPAVFPHRAGDRQQEGRRFRSGDRRRPRRRAGHARAHPAEFSRPRRDRRGIRRRAHRRRICLGARPDRRHQVVHHRHGGLGHADRADAFRRAGVRHDEPAVHAREILRRRRRRALPRTGRQSRLCTYAPVPRSATPSCRPPARC